MSFKQKIAFFFIAFSALFINATASADDGSPLEKTLRENVEYLTDTLHQGRAFGNPATVSLRRYVEIEFRKAGLQPLQSGYIHSFEQDGKIGHNVVGVLPGTNGKFILVCANADGIGKIGNFCLPGADSNASGMAALISLSSMLKSGGFGVIFAAFDGRVSGMAGSDAFYTDLSEGRIATSDGKVIKPSQIKLVTSIDIIGSTMAPFRPYWKNYVIALGGKSYENSILAANMHIWMHVEYDYYGSKDFTKLFHSKIGDQRVFLEHGIPAVVWTSGITMNTNKFTDVAATLDYPVFAERVTLIAKWLQLQIDFR